MDEWDLDLSWDTEEPKPEEKPQPKKKKQKQENPNEEKHINVTHRMGHRNITRRLASEKALEEQMPWHFQEGDCFHCFSFGDVDSFTFLKLVARQQRIKYLALSTWCIAGEDIQELEKWYMRGIIERVDFFMGEIFRGSYPEVYAATRKFVENEKGRLVVFRNHSKVMAIKGERFDVLIESSANVNTNPRSENTVMTVDSSLVNEYIKLFGEIIPFNKDDCGAEPYRVEDTWLDDLRRK